MTSIFLSHSWKDKSFVRKLTRRLEKYGIKVWLDEAELKIGDSLIQKIGQAIDDTDFVGVVLSNSSINSEWVQRELQTAIHKEFSKRRVVVLPILLEPVEIPPFLRDKVYADFTISKKFNDGLLRLLETLGVSTKKAEPIRESLGYIVIEWNDYADPPERFEVFGNKLNLDKSVAEALAQIVIPPDYVFIYFEDLTGQKTLLIQFNPHYHNTVYSGGRQKFFWSDTGEEIPIHQVKR